MGCTPSRAKGDASPAGSSSDSKETSAASATASSGVARRDDAASTSRGPIPTRSPDSAPPGSARDRPSSALATTYPIPTPASNSPRVPVNPAPAPPRWPSRAPPRSSRDPSETAFSDIASATLDAGDTNDASAEDASAGSSKHAPPSRAFAAYAELERAPSGGRVDNPRGGRVDNSPRRDGDETSSDGTLVPQAEDSDAARGRGAESDVERAARVVAKAVEAVRAATAKDARRVCVVGARGDSERGDVASSVGASEGKDEREDDEDEDETSRGSRFVPGVGVTSARRAAAARAARRAMERARGAGRGRARGGRGGEQSGSLPH